MLKHRKPGPDRAWINPAEIPRRAPWAESPHWGSQAPKRAWFLGVSVLKAHRTEVLWTLKSYRLTVLKRLSAKGFQDQKAFGRKALKDSSLETLKRHCPVSLKRDGPKTLPALSDMGPKPFSA